MSNLSNKDFLFSHIESMKRSGFETFEQFYLRELKHNIISYKHYKLLLKLIDKLQYSLFGFKKVDAIFVGDSRLLDLILSSRKYINSVIMATGKKDRLGYAKMRIPYISGNEWQNYLYEIFKSNSGLIQEAIINKLLKEIAAILKKYSPRWVILWSDSSPLEKAFILAANRLKIPTIDIQHGIFSYSIETTTVDGKYSDYLLVWGKFFKQMYLSKRIKEEDSLFVLGYPYLPKTLSGDKKRETVAQHKVCFLGQNFEKYDEKLFLPKVKTVKNVLKACQELDIPFIYRVHPGENKSKLIDCLPGIKFIPEKETLDQTIKNNSIFCSINSTSLIEASMAGKICFQLVANEFPSDNFEKLGICYSRRNDPNEIKSFLSGTIRGEFLPFSFKPSYVEIPKDLGTRFYQILIEIENRYSKKRYEKNI